MQAYNCHGVMLKTIKARAAAQPSQSVSSLSLVVYTSLCYNLIKLNLQFLLELLHTCVVVIYNRSTVYHY